MGRQLKEQKEEIGKEFEQRREEIAEEAELKRQNHRDELRANYNYMLRFGTDEEYALVMEKRERIRAEFQNQLRKEEKILQITQESNLLKLKADHHFQVETRKDMISSSITQEYNEKLSACFWMAGKHKHEIQAYQKEKDEELMKLKKEIETQAEEALEVDKLELGQLYQPDNLEETGPCVVAHLKKKMASLKASLSLLT